MSSSDDKNDTKSYFEMSQESRLNPKKPIDVPENPNSYYHKDFRNQELAKAAKAKQEADDPNPQVPPSFAKTWSTQSVGDRLSQPADQITDENMRTVNPEAGQPKRLASMGSMMVEQGKPNKQVSFTPSTMGDDGNDKQGGS
jgi:hypothetical protein